LVPQDLEVVVADAVLGLCVVKAVEEDDVVLIKQVQTRCGHLDRQGLNTAWRLDVVEEPGQLLELDFVLGRQVLNNNAHAE